MLSEISRAPTGTVPPDYVGIVLKDGSWIAIKGIDSHSTPDGGTVGVVTSTGEAAVFFTHVCGPGSTPLEGLITSRDSAAKALESLRASATEYKR